LGFFICVNNGGLFLGRGYFSRGFDLSLFSFFTGRISSSRLWWLEVLSLGFNDFLILHGIFDNFMLLLLVLRGSFLTLLILVLVTSSLRLSDGLNLFLGLLFFDMDAFSFLFDDSAGLSGLEGAGKVGRGLGELIKLVSDGVVLLSDDAGVLLL